MEEFTAFGINLQLPMKEDNRELLNVLKRLESLSSRSASEHMVRRNVTNDIVEVLISTDPTNAVLAEPLAGWLTQFLLQQQLKWEKSESDRLIVWLGAAKEAEVTNALYAIKALINAHPQCSACWEIFHPKCSKVLSRLGCVDGGVWNKEELVIGTVQCLNAVVDCFLESSQPTEEQFEFLNATADALISLHYTVRPVFTDHAHLSLFQLNSLALMGKVCAIFPNYARVHVSELFGLVKAYILYGVRNDTKAKMPTPQKVHASHQAVYVDEGDATLNFEVRRSCGGKVSKTRKPRIVSRGSRQSEITPNRCLITDDTIIALFASNLDIRTSDSDASEPEGATSRSFHERHGYTKIRLACITLLGVATRALERRMLYGFWHALFSGDVDSLLGIGLHDPAIRCRSAALQVAAQILLGSKHFLNQAEDSAKLKSSNFMSFSQNLGLLVVSVYDCLTDILCTESSLPVLTQALKCLAVLVQATPFQKFQSHLLRFVQFVRPMVHHCDSTIRVSALMVFEFLLSSSKLTPEIAKVVGLSPKRIKAVNEKHMPDKAVELVSMEYLEGWLADSDDADSEQDGITATDKLNTSCQDAKKLRTEGGCSWLLRCVLQNLEHNDEQNSSIKKATPVHIESLQVLSAMAAHFTLLNAHLTQLALALQNSLHPSLPADVRLYAGRCLDTCVYQMSCYLLDKTGEFEEYDLFWHHMLPIIMDHFHFTCDDAPALKICFCDSLSNIGALLFERLPHATQMQLLSFLSGISGEAAGEETTVRATAARALAVFVLFPSLRGNLVFAENTAELTLGLVADANMSVRVKVQWSLGNISEALLASSTQERVSDDLLRRLINVTVEACNDNDKVRCNAVRTLGNLLRILQEQHFEHRSCRRIVQKSMAKLANCILTAGTAKVKWNSCYAISNLMNHNILFVATRRYPEDLNWQTPLYSALCYVIVHHSNFKVRINAVIAIANIEKRIYFGNQFKMFWSALLAAIDQSERLENFSEYNHRDQLQQQLCLAMCHIVNCALHDDLVMLKKHLAEHLELVRNTWLRVTNRMVPEKVAPMLSCSMMLQTRFKDDLQLPAELKNAIAFIAQTFTCK